MLIIFIDLKFLQVGYFVRVVYGNLDKEMIVEIWKGFYYLEKNVQVLKK